MYKPKDTGTPPLFPELFPLGGALNRENRWLQLASHVNWQAIDSFYSSYFHPSYGRPAKDARLVCGLLLVKRLEGVSDARAVELFYESPYIQAFCGKDRFVCDRHEIDHSLLSSARSKMGTDVLHRMEDEMLRVLAIDKKLEGQFPRCHLKEGERGLWGRVKGWFSK